MGFRPSARRSGATRPVALLLLLAAFAASVLFAPAVAAQSDELGVATVRSRSGDPIPGGASATEFTIQLPGGAQCPGDSANDDYRIGSYMLPVDVNPFDVKWNATGPDPYGLSDYESFRQPLYDDLTSSYSSKALASNDGPGEPGQILDFPAFTFDVFEPGMIPPGRYNIGIVCNYYDTVTTAWNAVIEVTTDPNDVPAQITWTLVEGAAPAESGTNALVIVLVLLVVFLVAFAGFWLFLRTRSSTQSPNTMRGT